MSNTTRQPGYYRVKFPDREHVFPARLLVDNRWQFFGTNITRPFDEVEIADPTPIDPNPATQPDINQLMDVLQSVQYYFASPNGIGARDHAIRTSKKVDAVLELFRETPQPAGQLTPEGVMYEVFDLFNDHERGVITIEYRDEKVVSAIVKYAAHQTAAKDAEIAKLREEGHGWKSMHDAQMAEAKYLKSCLLDKEGEMQAKDARFKELEEQLRHYEK